jgi:predicted aspartyl protease
METQTMGRVLAEATIENPEDAWEVQRGLRPAEEARRLTIPNALVDTGASQLSMPTSLIRQLGLNQIGMKKVTSSTGPVRATLYGLVRLTVMGRDCRVDVLEVPDGVPVLIGQVPLELLDLVVNPCNHTLGGNPEHGGEHMYELY